MKKNPKKKIPLIIFAVIVLLLLLITVPAKVAPVISNSLSVSAHTDSSPLMVAHRGFSSIYPQNTLPAFEAAVENGFDGYELDIHTTKDGQWVVIHDDTVDSMTDGSGNVEDFTLEEIRKLNIDSGNGFENYENLSEKLKIPTLEEALAYCEGNEVIPVIEIKKCDTQYLSSLKDFIDENDLSDRAVIISFTKEYLEQYRLLDSEIQMLLLSSAPEKEDVDWCLEQRAGLNFNYFNYYKSADAVKYAREKGVKLAAWTVDNTLYKDIMVLFGAEIITTNKIKP